MLYNDLETKFNNIFEELKANNQFMYENPELGLQEFKSADKHCEILEKYGFSITKNICEIETAFIGEFVSPKEGPTIALLAEYDALPGVGHGCGHNLLGNASVGAGILLKDYINELGGKLLVIGTPAEETIGIKVLMSNKNIFDNVDIAMIVHPTSGDLHLRSTSSQAMEALEFSFKGKTSHAAGSPHLGINALDGVISLYNNINAMRQQILESDRVHGVITNGGKAANIIPDLAVANFYVRSRNKKELFVLREKVLNCAKGAALSSGTELSIRNYETTFLNLVTNSTLMNVYEESLKDIGITNMADSAISGSTDTGDVSQVCPAIHPYFPIYEVATSHSVAFADACVKDNAYKGMKEAIFALVLTGEKVLKDKILLEKIKAEFSANK